MTFTVSPTFTASPTPAYEVSGLGRAVLAPVPCRIGQPLCLYFDAAPSASIWEVFTVDQRKVADLSFGGELAQCWQTQHVAAGLYLVRVTIIYQDGSSKQKIFKAVVVN
jgi:hypothetical protein